MICLENEMRHGATLSDGRFRSTETIARISGYGVAHARRELRRMELAGLVVSGRGQGFAHGNRKTYRTAR